ncbi:MAG TPA: hypothetical protein VLC49_09785 [Solirubrobacteraceae bacterium]|nr:hypothetical protein [Solirubrobacteraceae bacterium]
MTALRTLAFGDGAVWGASWSPDSAGAALTALGSGSDVNVMPGLGLSDSGAGPADEWHLEAEGVALVAAPVGELVDVQAARDGLAGSEQLCRVTGTVASNQVDCLGVRSAWADDVELARFESIRAVSVWFDPDEAFALTAFRPRKTKHHDGDLLAAAVIGPDVSAAAEDPRLSTTYAADGWPVRAGVELWFSGEEPERQFPRRASGEPVGPRAQAVAGELELQAEPFRWHSRGRDAAGMYLLASRR